MQRVLAFMIDTSTNPNFSFVTKCGVLSWNICLLQICKSFDICKLFCRQFSRSFRIKVLTNKALKMCSKWTILFVSAFQIRDFHANITSNIHSCWQMFPKINFATKKFLTIFLFGGKIKNSWPKYLEADSAHHMVLLNLSYRILNHHVLSWMI